MSERASMAALATLLAALAMIGPFAIDTYLPAFPAIERDLIVSPVQMQQTLSLYLVAFAVMTLFHGTLSDSFGRRPVVLANIAAFALASLGCTLAASFEQLLVFRALQGASAGAGIVVGRAIIRDSFEGHAAQRLMSLVTMIFGLAPAIAPVIGGMLQQALGWRAVFGFLVSYSVALLVACHWLLDETLPHAQRQPFRLRPLARNYWTLGRSIPLFLISSAIAFNFAGFFLYILSAPAFVYDVLGLSAADFPWLFMPGIIGVMSGAYVSGRVAGRMTQPQIVTLAYAIMFAAAAFNVVYSAAAPAALPWSVLPIMIYTFGMALAMPTLTLLALDLFPQNRGLAASLMGFEHSFVSALAAGALSPMVSHSALTLAAGMTGLATVGWIAWRLYRHKQSILNA
ncbi:MAG TPA: multidrug effflux MFS transporter [Burkholderiales bacterium]|nr:multidrug effflux MFS transporter [Burkholderiales bacterium]